MKESGCTFPSPSVGGSAGVKLHLVPLYVTAIEFPEHPHYAPYPSLGEQHELGLITPALGIFYLQSVIKNVEVNIWHST